MKNENNCEPDNRLLASLAVFRTLYDSKKNVSDIIAVFLQEVIISQGKYRFNLKEVTNLLNAIYEFNIPEIIVELSLRSLPNIEKDNGNYSVKDVEELKSEDLSATQIKIQENNDYIIEKLFAYISEKENKVIRDNEKSRIVESFCSFLLDDSSEKDYYKYISAFIIHNKTDEHFSNQLNLIKEGVVLYSGIKYNNNLQQTGSWDSKLSIYIDTELLFYLAGYDGNIYQTLFIDFLDYVREINEKEKLISLLYFKDVENEITRFFAKAEHIVEGKEKLDPSRTAMTSICDGCTSASDIVVKKSMFFDLLQKHDILIDDYDDYFTESNHIYNIADENTIKIVSESIGQDDISEHIEFLNYINIHRKNNFDNYFDKIGYILLSGNSTTHRVAWHEAIKKDGNVPLATNLNFLTMKFWFRLNKGFGGNKYPKSFDIITKSQMVLSTQLNASVGIQYEELQEKFRRDELSEEVAIATIANLRKQVARPEEIEDSNIERVLESISDHDIERYILEQEQLKTDFEKEIQEKNELRKDLEKNKKQLDQVVQSKKSLSEDYIKSMEKLLDEKNKAISRLENQKKPIDSEVVKSFRNLRLFIGFLVILFYALSFILLGWIGWETMEQYFWILSSIPIVITIIFLLIIGKTFNPLELLNAQRKRIQRKIYKKFSFDPILLNELKTEVTKLEEELKG